MQTQSCGDHKHDAETCYFLFGHAAAFRLPRSICLFLPYPCRSFKRQNPAGLQAHAGQKTSGRIGGGCSVRFRVSAYFCQQISLPHSGSLRWEKPSETTHRRDLSVLQRFRRHRRQPIVNRRSGRVNPSAWDQNGASSAASGSKRWKSRLCAQHVGSGHGKKPRMS